VTKSEEAVEPRDCPYVGLDYYHQKFGAWFFGREEDGNKVITNLQATRLTLLHAESGVGKSSILRAEVAWRLRRLAHVGSPFGDEVDIPVVFSSWKDDPVRALVGAIGTAIEPFLASRPKPELPTDRLDAAIGAASDAVNASLLIMLDQFEEYFLYRAREPVPGRFADELARCINASDLRANFLIAIREDAYAGLGDLFKGRIASVYGNYLHIEYLDRASAEEAIRAPLDVYNGQPGVSGRVTIQDALVQAVLDQVRAFGAPAAELQGRKAAMNGAYRAATPLLQLVMETIWEHERAEGSCELRLSTLQNLEGVEKIVDTHLGNAVRGLSEDERQIAIDTFDHLVTPSGGKIAESVPDLAHRTGHSEERIDQVLEKLDHARIVRPVPAPPGQDPMRFRRYEIFHDVLAPAINRTIAVSEEQRRARQLRLARRARWLRLVRSVGVTVSVVIALTATFAFLQRNQAIVQRNLAVYFRATAEALEFGTTNTPLAAQLDLAAYRMQPGQDLASRLLSTENIPLSFPLAAGSKPAYSVAYSPDGHALASSDGDGMVRLWNLANPARPRAFGKPLADVNAVPSVAFSPHGRVLAAGDIYGGIRLWDAADPAHPRLLGRPLNGGTTDAIESMAFSSDGRTLATGNHAGVVRLWDVADPAHPRLLGRPLNGGTGVTLSVAFSSDGHTLADGTSSGAVWLWDVADAAHPRRLGQLKTGRTGAAASVAFSPDGHVLASGKNDGTVRLWDVADPAHASLLGQPLTGGTGVAYSVAFSPDGHALASGNADGTIRLWDVADAAQPQSLGQPLTGHTGAVLALAFSPDGHTLAGGDFDGTVRLWNLPETTLTGGTGSVLDVALSPDGRTLASADLDGTVWLWDVADPAHPRLLGPPLTGGAGAADSVAFSPDGHTLADGNHDGTIRLWDVADPAHPRLLGPPLTGGAGAADSVVFSPDSRTLASGTSGGSIRLWEVADPAHPQIVHQFPKAPLVESMAFSPDGRVLATAFSDEIVLWNIAADPVVPPPLGQPLAGGVGAGAFYQIAFSPDGHRLASGADDGSIRLWDVADPAHPRLLGHPLTSTGIGTVYSVAFSPDGRMLASGNDDGTIGLWNIADPVHPQQLGQPLTGGTESVYSVLFSPDGHTLFSGSIDGAIRLWNPDVNYAIKLICATAGDLTPQQWQAYITQLPYQPLCAH
jgi:WD40 repeat protein